MYLNLNASHFTPSGFMTASGITNNAEQYVKVADFKINIQPADGQSTVLVNGLYGRTFNAFMTYSGLNIEDKITISGTTDEYRVRAVKPFNYAPMKHYEVILTLPEI
jgi:hypothetical protein